MLIGEVAGACWGSFRLIPRDSNPDPAGPSTYRILKASGSQKHTLTGVGTLKPLMLGAWTLKQSFRVLTWMVLEIGVYFLSVPVIKAP